MNKFVKGAVATLAVLSLAACGSGGGDGSPAPSTGAPSTTAGLIGEGETLTVWIMEGTNPDSTAFFDEVGTAFKEKTGADLDVQMVPWASAKEKFATAIAGGTTPDVAEVGNTWTAEFAEAGALVDLTSRVEGDGLNGDLVEGLVQSGTLDGSLYGMPWYAGVRAFVYNTEIFEKAGVEVPTNWAELQSTVEAIKASQPDVIPFPIVGASEFSAYPWVWGAGGDIAVEKDGAWTSTINSPEAVEGLKFYTDLALVDGSSTPAAATWKETDVLAAFEQGNVAMSIQGSWTPARIIADAPEMEGKLGAFTIPAKDGGVAPSFLGGSHLGVFEGTKNEDLSWEFVKLMSTGEFAQKWGESANYFPGQTSLLEQMEANADELTSVFIRQMVDGGASTPVTPTWGAIQGQQVTPTMIQSILSGQATAQEAADKAAETMNATFGG
ncbi:sugar ABC transporter substrate-binding protein [Tessaracoccus defluvii]|uniref:Sugar ABC transporter substrate-binding protein n=1 Tax=Tessaracoccus defluvii TaxID=1285901 RepID=A0A7H0H3H3_9ACTN|nr:sugar ABC transporter substrate-binding protein [Tessaracoccus defluvii]QNP55089.1 sugar ABC transporter substrate-binding protein [Tessaracoccus defluvii]